MIDDEERLRYAYAAFNARNVDAALATMHPDVEWPNGITALVDLPGCAASDS